MSVYNWSKTAASNATADATINWAEGQAPSTVNDSARAEMAAMKKWVDDVSGTVTTGGTSTAYTITTNSVFSTAALMSGALICFIPHATNGASPTLAVDGLTARAINKSTGVAVTTGAMLVGTPYLVTYIHASTEFILVGKLGVLDGTLVGGTLTTTTLTGTTTFTDKLIVPDGTAGAPAISQTGGASDCGMYFIADDQIGFTAGGTLRVTITGSTLTTTGAINAATAAGSMLASQAEQETGTATDKVVAPGTQGFHNSAAKAWGKFTCSNGTSSATYNCSTARDSQGVYTVTIGTDFSSANYAVAVTLIADTETLVYAASNLAAGSFKIRVYTPAGVATDADEVSFVCFGDQ